MSPFWSVRLYTRLLAERLFIIYIWDLLFSFIVLLILLCYLLDYTIEEQGRISGLLHYVFNRGELARPLIRHVMKSSLVGWFGETNRPENCWVVPGLREVSKEKKKIFFEPPSPSGRKINYFSSLKPS